MRRRHRIPAAAAAVLLLAAGCTAGEQDLDENPGPEHVVLVTGSGSAARDAYAWVALEQGYFAEAGLEVEIRPGTGTAETLGLVAGQQAQFALADLTELTLQLGGGSLSGVTAVAAIHQLTPAGFVSLAEQNIRAPGDLAGRSVAAPAGSLGRVLWPVYADLAGVDRASVELLDAEPGQLPTLLAGGTAELVSQPELELPGTAAATGSELSFLPYRQYLPDLYGDALVTSVPLAQRDGELVGRFRDALLRGLELTVDRPAEAVRILAGYQPVDDPELAAAELAVVARYAQATGDPLGSLDGARVSQGIAVLEAAGAIPPVLTSDDVITSRLVVPG